LRVLDAQNDSSHGISFGAGHVRVLDIDAGLSRECQDRGQPSWHGRDWYKEYIALRHLIMPFTKYGRGVHVVVDHQAKLTAALEPEGDDVDALVAEETAYRRQRAWTVGQAEIELCADRHAERGYQRRESSR